MSGAKETFSFPFPAEKLPSFPKTSEPPLATAGSQDKALSQDDIEDLHALLGLFGPHWLRKLSAETEGKPGKQLSEVAPETAMPVTPDSSMTIAAAQRFAEMAPESPMPIAATPHVPVDASRETSVSSANQDDFEKKIALRLRSTLLRSFEKFPADGSERDLNQAFRILLANIENFDAFLACYQAVIAAVPASQTLRFGTPDQRQYALSVMTDRSLQILRGVVFPERQRFLKALAGWASEVSGTHTFLVAEQEPFNNQHWERVPGANPGSSTIREMRGFLVIRTDTRQVVRLGRAMT